MKSPSAVVRQWARGEVNITQLIQPQSMAFGISVPGTCWYLSFFRQVKGRELTVISCPKYRASLLIAVS